MFLYTISNIFDGKQYAGITNNIKRRWKEHQTELNSNRHGNKHLQAAWNLYKKQSFIFEVVGEYSDIKDLNAAEIDFIAKNNLINPSIGYNVHVGGVGRFLHTDGAKNNISKSQEVAVVSMCLKTGAVKKYNRIKDVELDGMNVGSIANPCTDRALTYANKVWMYLKDYEKNPEVLSAKKDQRMNVKSRPSRYGSVFGMNIQTKEIVQYSAVYHAMKDGFNHQTIYKCCTKPNVSKSHKGFVWSFDEKQLICKIKIVLKNKTHRVV